MKKMVYSIREKYIALDLTKKAVLWFTFATIVQNAISFLVTPIYTRILSGDEYGIYSIYQSWLQIFSVLSVLALDRCMTVGFMKFDEERENFLSSIQFLMTILVAISCLIVFILQHYFVTLINLPLYIIIIILIVSLLNNSISNWTWYQRYLLEYKKLTMFTIVSTIIMQVFSMITILFFPSSNKGIIFILSLFLSRLIIYGCIYVSVYRTGHTLFRKEYWTFSLKYSIAVIPHALAQIILNSSDRIMIDKFCTRAETAYYGVTYSAAMVLNIIVTSLSTSVQPTFFEKMKIGDYEGIKKITNMMLLISAFLAIVVSTLAPEILSIMAPPEYKVALGVFPSIAASVYFNSMYLYFANFESYYEKPIYFSIATSIGAVINIVLNFVLIPIFGFVVAGYTTLFCYMVFAIMHYYFMRKICKEKIQGLQVFNLGFLCILSIFVLFSTLIVTLFYKWVVIRYILVVLVCIAIFMNREKLKQMSNLSKNA